MNYLYAINFAPGFEGLVADILKRSGGRVVFNEEAFAMVEYNKEIDASDLEFAKSIIQVFDYANDLKNLKLAIPDSFKAPSVRAFCIRNFDAGKPAKMEEADRVSLIQEISNKTKLKYSSFEPDVDFVVAKRRDGMSYFGYKLDFGSSKKHQKGEINFDIANLLAKLGDIKAGAKVLDAFAGYGGVSKEIIRSFKLEQVVAVEKNSTLVNRLKTEFGNKSKVRVVASDAVHFLKSTELEFDLIIADPPWGEVERTLVT